MAELTWISSSSGNWSTASDWSGGAVPSSSDDVTIAVAGVTVTVSTGTLAVDSITTSLSTLSITGGTLSVGNFVLLGGAWQQSGGFVAVDNGATFNNTYAQSGGSLTIKNNLSFEDGYAQTGGTLTSLNTATFAGNITQSSGLLLLEYQGATFNGAVTQSGGIIKDLGLTFIENGNFVESKGSTGNLTIAGTGGIFNSNVTLSGGTIDLLSGTLAMAGAETTLGGTTANSGTVTGNGTLVIAGQQNGLNGTTTIETGAVLSIGKLALVSGELALNRSTFTYAGYYSGTGNSTLALGGNKLTLNGGAELADQVSGGGTIIVSDGGQLNGVTLNNSVVLDITSAVTVVPVQNQGGLVTLQNSSLITIASTGTLRLTGNDVINDVSYNGSLLDDGLLNDASGSGLAEIIPSFTEGASAKISIGLGTLDFSGGTNTFLGSVSGAGTLSFGRDNTGQPQTFTVDSANAFDVGSFVFTGQTSQDEFNLSVSKTLTFGGNWDQSGGIFLFGNGNQEPGPVIDFTGSNAQGSTVLNLDGGVIKSSTGTMYTAGLVTIGNSQTYPQGVDIEGFTTFIVTDLVRQSASMQFGAQSGSLPTATITTTGTWLLEDASSINGVFGSVSNFGLLEKNNGSGVSSIQGTFANYNQGLLDIAASQVLLDGNGSIDGTVTGAGQLDFEGSGTYYFGGQNGTSEVLQNGTITTTASTLALTVGHVLIDNTPTGQNASVVSLDLDLSYAGVWAQHGGTVQLNNNTLTLSGTTALDGGTLTGVSPFGTLVSTLISEGPTTLGGSPNSTFDLGSYAVLDITKFAEQSTSITVSNLGTLNIVSGALYAIDDTETIYGGGLIDVAGTLNSNGAGYTAIDPAIVATGKINVTEGTLACIGSVAGGNFTIDRGAQLDFDNAVTSSTTVTMSAGHASLLLGDAPADQGLVSGFISTDFIEFAQLQSGLISDTLSSNGETLTISDSANHTFTVAFAQAQTITSLQIADGPNGYIGVYHI